MPEKSFCKQLLPAALIVCLAISASGVRADSDSFTAAQRALDAIAAGGRTPGFREFVDIVNTEGSHLTEGEFMQLRGLVQARQTPAYTPGDLAELITTKREMIADYVIEVKSDETGSLEGVTQPHHRYAMIADGGKYLTREWLVNADGSEVVREVISYDGEIVRRFKPDTSGAGQGVVTQLQAEHPFHLLNPQLNPIWNSMLLNSKAQLGEEMFGYDLVALLNSSAVVLYSEPQIVDGHSCLVVEHVTIVAYLDPDLDFAVVRREGWNPPSPDGFHRRGWVASFSGFADAGSGLILPTVMTFENAASGRRHVVSGNSQ